MNTIHVLDCTLRDGGYCNEWKFGHGNIIKISQALLDAKIDIIECGFLTQKADYDLDVSKFVEVSEISQYISNGEGKSIYVAMINYGEYDIKDIPVCDGTSISGIRIAFHKKDMKEALELCRIIKEKGYLVFIQPMISMNYSDIEFLTLISEVNTINPYAFYIVDSFGVMKAKDLSRFFYIIEYNLKKNIKIGFHAHNNMQLAFSNAQILLGFHTNHDLIIDSCVYGMGRGAGNLNTEIFVEYLNDNYSTEYKLEPILSIIDEVINQFYERKKWGYSLPNYLSAIHMIHPNYASFLDEKKTLTIEEMNNIFSMMKAEKSAEFDKEYISSLYIEYLSKGEIRDKQLPRLFEKVRNRDILLIAPGKNALYEKEKILSFIEENNPITININHSYLACETDYIFISNIRRFRELDPELYYKTISTSNIKSKETCLSVDYYKLLNEIEYVRDNAGLMAISFAMNYLNVEKVYLAGFDGYSYDSWKNYATRDMVYISSKEQIDNMNEGMKTFFRHIMKRVCFVTTSIFE